MDGPIDEGCITSEELAAWLKLVENDILKPENTKPMAALPEPLEPANSSRTILVVIATLAGSVTLAWLAFLVWLAFKGISLLS